MWRVRETIGQRDDRIVVGLFPVLNQVVAIGFKALVARRFFQKTPFFKLRTNRIVLAPTTVFGSLVTHANVHRGGRKPRA